MYLRNAQPITSTKNQAVRRAVLLKQRRHRNTERRFRIEGYREVERALVGGIKFEAAFYCPSISRFNLSNPILRKISDETQTVVYETSEEVFTVLSQWQNPDGLLVVAHQPETTLDSFEPKSGTVLLVIDGLEKPGNLGAVFRSADAAGCDGILLSDVVVDVFNPNVIRSSLGTLFSVPFCVSHRSEIVKWLRKRQLNILSTSPSANWSYDSADIATGCALVIGSEKDGLPQAWLEVCDESVTLPTEGQADSLNAAMTATVLLFESNRQRKTKLLAT